MEVMEKQIEQYLRRQVLAKNGLCMKLDSEKGQPDRLVLTPLGRHIFVEVKRRDGHLSPAQVEYHRRLRERRHAVFVLWSFNDVDKFMKRYFPEVHDA